MAPHRALRRIYALEDFEPAARRHLPRPVFGYVAGASETGATLADNRRVFDEIGFLPRSLVDVSGRALDRRVLGRDCKLPFGIAPMGVSALTAYRGDLVLARAARRAGIPMVISGAGLIALEEIAAANPDAWFQAYLPGDPDEVMALVDRVARAGLDTFVVTVDCSVGPIPENYLRAGYRTPIRPSLALLRDGITHPRWALGTFLRTFARHGMPHFENGGPARGAPLLSSRAARDFSGRERLDWALLHRIRARWQGRLVLKGIIAPDDVTRARTGGVDAVILSNHGGRQLDGAVSPLRVLAAALAEAGDMEVMIDSGFRRGTDILKALALGARFVFVGRPFNYAAAIAGEAGVDHAIGLLRAQLRAALGMLGLTRLDDLGPEALFLRDFRTLPVPG
ncbi:MAG: alpha-hydroxy acid oxidase [Gemmobacter sp.]